MMKFKLALLGAASVFIASQATAAPNNLPPPGGAILDLNGQPITNVGQVYTVGFTAGVASTAITFAFRQDPAFEGFSNASLVDLTNPSGNLLLDGDFSLGTPGSNSPPDWTYANIYGATFGGVVGTPAQCGALGTCWYDGAVQAYDAISQTVATNIGDSYLISFTLNGGASPDGIYRRISDNGQPGTGGNGIDVLAYAQAGLPPPGTPEPTTWALMILGLGGIGAALRGSRRTAIA